MTPEKAGLFTLRAQLNYAQRAMDDKKAQVSMRQNELDKAQFALAEAQKDCDEYVEAIRILEEAGYGGTDDEE